MSECQVPSDTSLRTSGYFKYGRIKGRGKIDFRVRIRQRLTSGRIRQREGLFGKITRVDAVDRYWILFLLVIHTHM